MYIILKIDKKEKIVCISSRTKTQKQTNQGF